MINNVVLVGRITRDPELNKTQSGTSFCRFTVACNRRVRSQNGQPDADFISCVAWQRTAEIMCQYLRKGALIGVEGRITTSSFDNNQGQRVYRTEVTAESVQFLESKNTANNSDWNRSNSGYNQQPSYQNAPQPAFNSYQSSGSSYNNHSAGNDPFAASASSGFDNAFNDDSLDIASDDLPF
ncbi:MAG: single-stranded DNA-binding protein [Ileibacterium sp.]|nr:single-stranded DNA-binding protein [Ileibacterium sp.]